MCHGKYKEKPKFERKEGKRVPYNRVTKHKQSYEYSEDEEQEIWQDC